MQPSHLPSSKTFSPPRREVPSPLQALPTPVSQPQTTTINPLSVSVEFPVLDISYKWNHTLCYLPCLAFHRAGCLQGWSTPQRVRASLLSGVKAGDSESTAHAPGSVCSPAAGLLALSLRLREKPSGPAACPVHAPPPLPQLWALTLTKGHGASAFVLS